MSATTLPGSRSAARWQPGVGAIHGVRVRSVTIIGSSGVGPSGSAVELLKVRHLAGEERRRDASHFNLNRLMIADAAKIDDLALAIQEVEYAAFAAGRSPTLSQQCGALPNALKQVVAPVMNGIWGERDAPAKYIHARRSAWRHCARCDRMPMYA